MDLSLETSRLTLRGIQIHADDLVSYLGWLRDTKNNPFIKSARLDYSMRELVEFINSVGSDDNSIFFGIFLKNKSQFIGTLKVQPINYFASTAWLGIMIGSPEFRGLGFGREALEKVLDYLFNSLELQEIYLGVDLQNLTAISLYRSLGFSEHKLEVGRMVMMKSKIT